MKTSIHNETVEILTEAKKLIARIQRAIRAGGNGGKDDEAILDDLRGMLYNLIMKTSIHNETIEILTDAKKLTDRIQRAIRAGGNGGKDDKAILDDLRGMLYILRLTSGCLDSQLIVDEKTLNEWDSIEHQ